MIRAYELRQKEVINISDGARLGFIYDVEINFELGKIEALVLPGKRRFFGLFGSEKDIVVPWEKIIRVGDDIVLVDFNYKICELGV